VLHFAPEFTAICSDADKGKYMTETSWSCIYEFITIWLPILLALASVYEFLDQWQTLIAALIALAAAKWTISTMNKQRADQTDRHDASIKRREMAARAQMPGALSELCTYTEESGRYLTQQRPDMPNMPVSAITTLQTAVEHIEDGAASRSFELVSWFQVHRARADSVEFPIVFHWRSEIFYDLERIWIIPVHSRMQ